MEDDTIYFPRDDFEREFKKEKGIRAFREFRRKLEEEAVRESGEDRPPTCPI